MTAILIALPLMILNSILFLAISILHFYWANGGKWASQSVVPTLALGGQPVFSPNKFATVIVGFGLLFMSAISFLLLFYINSPNFGLYLLWTMRAIGFLFLIRTIGDMKYVGIFKKVKNTDFAKNDTKYYTPLCLYLALSCLFIGYFA